MRGRHFLRHGAGDDHEIRLAGRRSRDDAETVKIIFAGVGRHHLDGAAGQPKGQGPDARFAGPIDEGVRRGHEQRPAGDMFCIEGPLSSRIPIYRSHFSAPRAPGVNQPEEQDRDENEHAGKPGPAQLFKDDGPGIEIKGFDVKNDETGARRYKSQCPSAHTASQSVPCRTHRRSSAASSPL